MIAISREPLSITEILYDQGEDAFQITWSSNPSATYSLFFSTDGSDWGADVTDVTDGIGAQGETTTYPDPGDPNFPSGFFPNPLPGAQVILFRVQENE